ncbi:quinone oxidoreductase family protein [Amantichitinum ursilacus]|uniref:Quinone oxidoreductase 1 n=1 Tax=Amantichitinum ursilacus TaxID=857265 RepID=A0A0N0XHP7_9NEIS|nr:quinone oxidoreductase [Amantichitinum ursilacus]KPC49792.1 Quinone oxidoreductase 1 [Amantichitinum ursilacus]
MSAAIVISAPGAPEVLHLIDQTVPAPGPGQVGIRQRVAGVNFVDVYFRQGQYPLAQYPAVAGFEGAGVIESVGAGVDGWQVGQRVAYMGAPMGGYAEERVLPASALIAIPDGVDDATAGGSMLRGLTAYMLLHRVYALQPGDWLLVHAAAGGLGQLLTRWAVRKGAQVIGTVSSEAKANIAHAAGAQTVLLHSQPDWPQQVRALADGVGVHLAVDGIGGPILPATFGAVRPFGVVANIGQAGGAVAPVDISKMGPIALAKPSVLAFATQPEWYYAGAQILLNELQSGLHNPIGQRYALADAAQAHRDLENGKTTGSVILTL